MGASSTYTHGSDSNQSDWFTASGAEGQETPTKQIASKSYHIFRFFDGDLQNNSVNEFEFTAQITSFLLVLLMFSILLLFSSPNGW